MRVSEKTSTAIDVSLDGSLGEGLKIVTLHIDGSEATLTILASITKDGMTYIKTHGLMKMFESSGLLETKEQKENGNERVE